MTTIARFVVVSALVLLAGRAAFAQPPTAPPPHPPLRELVQEYIRLGLPLPPPDAPLVRIAIKKEKMDHRDAPRVYFSYLLGFRLSPTAPGKDPRYLIGYGRLWHNSWFDPALVEVIEPKPESLKDIQLDYYDAIPLAVQCELRGWHILAGAVYGMGRKQLGEIAEMNQEAMPSLIGELREYALDLRERHIDDPGSDRKALLKRIKELVAEEPSFLIPWRKQWLHQLELAVAPRTSKPGSVEALIDDLTEYWEVPDWGPWDEAASKKGQQAYWKLAELGFDAIPALIAHLNDDRATRATFHTATLQVLPYSTNATVGHLCTRLLINLSAREIGRGLVESRGDRLDPTDARKWFAAARKIGEEKWLVSHAVPARLSGDAPYEWPGRPEPLLLRVIGAKYPQRIPELYRAILKRPYSDFRGYIDGLLASKLTREQKIALFEEGFKSSEVGHRLDSLKGLSQLDRPLFAKRLQDWLRELPKRAPDDEIPEDLVPLVKQSGDRHCWDFLLTATKASPYWDRMEVIAIMGRVSTPDDPDPIRRERLRFFAAFLDDREAVRDKNDDGPPAQVRDNAAYRMAAMFRFPVEHDCADPLPLLARQACSDQGPITRLLLREAVRELAKRELARPGK